jgi:hypothetical protein
LDTSAAIAATLRTHARFAIWGESGATRAYTLTTSFLFATIGAPPQPDPFAIAAAAERITVRIAWSA